MNDLIAAFQAHLKNMTAEDWEKARRNARLTAADNAMRVSMTSNLAPWDDAWNQVALRNGVDFWEGLWADAKAAYGKTAWDKVSDATKRIAAKSGDVEQRDDAGAAAAVGEIMAANMLREHVRGQVFYFLPMFGFLVPSEVAA